MAIEKFKYPRRFSIFDGAGRERQGYMTTFQRYGDGAGSFYNFEGNPYYQYFFIDFTDNTTWHTMLSLANNVRYQMKPKYVVTPSTGAQVVTVQYRIIGENDAQLMETETTMIIDNRVDTDIHNVKLLATYFKVHYSDEESLLGVSANDINVGVDLWTRKENETGLYPTPTQKYSLSDWLGNYSLSSGLTAGLAYTDEALDDIIESLKNIGDGTAITPILPSEDTTEPGGGDDYNPVYDSSSDPIGFPELPTGGDSISTGFIRVYQPTASQLQQLAGVLWSDDFVDTIKKIQNDPMEAIISLHSIPVNVAYTSSECRIGNFNTGVTMPTISSQYVKRNLGYMYIPEHWASALDYSPYVSIDIYLPYLGVRSLQVDDVIGKYIGIEYNIDVLSGACVINIMCGNSVLYTYNTNIISEHPISQSSFAPMLQSMIGGVGNVLSGYGSAGGAGAVGALIGSAVNVAIGKQHSISRGGSIGGNTGCLGGFTPYLIIHRPIQSLASGFAHFKGYPSNITATLGNVSGYTEVESVHLNGITCTDNEKAEIEALLYNGVIL